MSTRDPSLFGWLLPEPGQLHPIGELLFVAIGYGFLLWLIIKLMKHFLSSKPWHKWLRRSIWTVLAVLMFIDPFYYYFGIVRGYCAQDRARVYPAPPASYVLAGPVKSQYEQETLKNDLELNQKTSSNLLGWRCTNIDATKMGYCVVENIEIADTVNPLLFGFKRISGGVIDSLSKSIYWEGYKYQSTGHWLSKMLFGFSGSWIHYEKFSSCSITTYSPNPTTPIKLNEGMQNGK